MIDELVDTSKSTAILDKVVTIWRGTRKSMRDGYISIGKLLFDFVIARLSEGDGLPEATRRNKHLNRESAIKIASNRLGVNPKRVHDIMKVTKVVELFGDPGSLSYSALRVFTVLIQRKRHKVTRTVCAINDEVNPSESELWEIRKDTKGDDPIELYKQAVSEDWDSVRTRKTLVERINIFYRRSPGPRSLSRQERDRDEYTESYHVSLQSLGRDTNPKDLVDMVIEMVNACPRAEELKKLIIERIR